MNEQQRIQYENLCEFMRNRGGRVISDNYIHSKTPIEVICGCGYRYSISPSSLKRTKNCRKCKPNNSSDARSKFNKMMEQKEGVVIKGEECMNARSRILVQCKNSHLFETTMANVNRGTWCRECGLVSIGLKLTGRTCTTQIKISSEAKRKTITDIIETKSAQLLNDINLVKLGTDKLCIICENNHEWNPTVRVLLGGAWCPECRKEYKKLSGCTEKEIAMDEFMKKVVSSKCVVVGNYTNVFTPVEIECANNHRFYVQPRSFKRRQNICDICLEEQGMGRQKKFEKMVAYKKGTLHSEYKREEKILVQCSNKHFWWAEIDNIAYRDSWCPTCNVSKGEFRVAEVLDSLGIDYQREAEREDIPRKKYDFYFIYEEIHYYLEYDGDQHFVFSDHLHKTQEIFDYRRDIDRLKTWAVLHEESKIIRIDYLSFSSIEECILEALELKQDFYVSDTEMYSWLTDSSISISLIEKECIIDNLGEITDNIIKIDWG